MCVMTPTSEGIWCAVPSYNRSFLLLLRIRTTKHERIATNTLNTGSINI